MCRLVLYKTPTSFDEAIKEAASEERNEKVTAGVPHERARGSVGEPRYKMMSALHARLGRVEKLLPNKAYHGTFSGHCRVPTLLRCHAYLELRHIVR